MGLTDITTQNPEPALKESKTCEEKDYLRLTNPQNSLRASLRSLTISSQKIKTMQRSSTLGATR